MMRYSREILSINEVMGRYVETAAFQHSRIMCERLAFWRTPQKEEVQTETGLVPVEVKYREIPDISANDGIIKFMDKYKLKFGVVVTKDLFAEKNIDNKNILFLPVWLFLWCA